MATKKGTGSSKKATTKRTDPNADYGRFNAGLGSFAKAGTPVPYLTEYNKKRGKK